MKAFYLYPSYRGPHSRSSCGPWRAVFEAHKMVLSKAFSLANCLYLKQPHVGRHDMRWLNEQYETVNFKEPHLRSSFRRSHWRRLWKECLTLDLHMEGLTWGLLEKTKNVLTRGLIIRGLTWVFLINVLTRSLNWGLLKESLIWDLIEKKDLNRELLKKRLIRVLHWKS